MSLISLLSPSNTHRPEVPGRSDQNESSSNTYPVMVDLNEVSVGLHHSQISFTEDCLRALQDLVRTVGNSGVNIIISTCLSYFNKDVPINIINAVNNLYTAVTQGGNYDIAALNFLGLAAEYLPEDLNFVAGTAATIREMVTDWLGEDYLQQFLGDDENNYSSNLFTALAVIAFIASYCMKDNGAPQRPILKAPSYFVKIILRVNQYWNWLGAMASHAMGGEDQEDTCTAFAVKSQVQRIENASNGERGTGFSATLNLNPECYTPAPLTGATMVANYNTQHGTSDEIMQGMLVDKFKQVSGVNPHNCNTEITTQSEQINEVTTTVTTLITQCGASVDTGHMPKLTTSEPKQSFTPQQHASSAGSRSGGDALQPMIEKAALVVGTSTLIANNQMPQNKKPLYAVLGVLTTGFTTILYKTASNLISSQPTRDADSEIVDSEIVDSEIVDSEIVDSADVDAPPLALEITQREEGSVAECKTAPISSTRKIFNDYSLSNMPYQKTFKEPVEVQPSRVIALNEFRIKMQALVGENNLKEYLSIEELQNTLVSKPKVILVRVLLHTIKYAINKLKIASEELNDQSKKNEILFYLSYAIRSENEKVLEETYARLGTTAAFAYKLIENLTAYVTFFERLDKRIPLPQNLADSPMVLVNKKHLSMLKINLEGLDERVEEYVIKESSSGYIPELAEAIMRAAISQAGKTNDILPLARYEHEGNRLLGTHVQAFNAMILKDLVAKHTACEGVIYPDDNAVREILQPTLNEPLTDEMRELAVTKLSNPQDEYFQRKTGKESVSLLEQQQIKNSLTWVYAGSVESFKARQFFYDPVYRADTLTSNTDSTTIFLRDIANEGAQEISLENSLVNSPDLKALFKHFEEIDENLKTTEQLLTEFTEDLIFLRTGKRINPKTISLVQFSPWQTVIDRNRFTGFAHPNGSLSMENVVDVVANNFDVPRKRHNQAIEFLINSAAGQAMSEGTYPQSLLESKEGDAAFSSLDRLTGLYHSVNSNTINFSASNEIPYRPSQLKADIFEADIMQRVLDHIEYFFTHYIESYIISSKSNFIFKVRLARFQNILSEEGYKTAMHGGVSNVVLQDPVTIDELKAHSAPSPWVKASFLSINIPVKSSNPRVIRRRSYKTNILCFTNKEGLEVIYLPGREKGILEFKNANQLSKWFMEQIRNKVKRNLFLQHVSLKDRIELVEQTLIAFGEGKYKPPVNDKKVVPEIIKTDLDEQEDPITALALLSKKHSIDVADVFIRSNGEVTLESVSFGLTLVNLAFLPFIPLFGTIGYAVGTALSTAQLITNIVSLQEADTPEEKEEALTEAGFNLLFLSFDGLMGASNVFKYNKGIKSGTSAHKHGLPKSGAASLKQQGSAQGTNLIGKKNVKIESSIVKKDGQLQPVKNPVGQHLNLPMIDDANEEIKAELRQMIYQKGDYARELNELFKKPKEACYAAAVSTSKTLRTQGEKPQTVAALFYKKPQDLNPKNHYVTLVNKNGVDLVIDPTINQFGFTFTKEETIFILDDWERLMKNIPGDSEDTIIFMKTYPYPSAAYGEVSMGSGAKGLYYENKLFSQDNINILKSNARFKTAIIQDHRRLRKELSSLEQKGESAIKSDKYRIASEEFEKVKLLKTHFGLYDPYEIKIAHQIISSDKKKFAEFTVETSEIPALSSKADYRGITNTVTDKSYIRVRANEWIQIEEAQDSFYYLIYKGQRVQSMYFNVKPKQGNKSKWEFTALI